MTFIIPKDESTSGRLTVPIRLFTSNGTSPDTGASNDSIRLSANGASDFTATNKLSALSAAAGMYTLLLTQSEVSTLGSLVGWHWQGDFPQHVFTAQIVNNNPMSTLSAISDVTLAAKEYSNVTVRLGLVAYSGATVGVANIAAGSYSGVTVQGLSNYANISDVTLHAGTHSGATIQGLTRALNLSANGDKTGYSISGTKTTLDALNDIDGSGVTLHAGTHSGATVQGVSNYANLPLASIATSIWSGKRSDFTTPGSFGEYVYSQVTGISTGTVFGVTDTSNFPGGSSSASSPEQIADYVWSSYLTRTLTSFSTATVLAVVRLSTNNDKTGYSISGTKTTLDALNDIDGSGVTLHAGTHSGATVQGVTRALNLSANGDKTGYSISGTKTTLDALNDIDGSGVTLHAGTHSGATVQGVTRVNSSVTIADGAYSAVSVQVGATGLVAGSIGAGALTNAKFAAGAIDAAALATDAGQEIADAVLGRNIAGGSSAGRTVSQALYPLRNRVQIEGSTLTVYGTDDSTSAWTASITTGSNPMSGMDPVT